MLCIYYEAMIISIWRVLTLYKEEVTDILGVSTKQTLRRYSLLLGNGGLHVRMVARNIYTYD